jgi:hypothetical protein
MNEDQDKGGIGWGILGTIGTILIVLLAGLWAVGGAVVSTVDALEDTDQHLGNRLTLLEGNKISVKALLVRENRLTIMERDIIELQDDSHVPGAKE